MYMTVIFSTFAAIAALGGLLMPHLVHNLGYRMAALYLACALCSALLTIIRRTG